MTMKVAVVGTGGVAEKNYLPYIVEREDIQLSYLNRTRSKAEAVAERFGGRVAADAADLMADEPDACLIIHQGRRTGMERGERAAAVRAEAALL